MTRKHFEAIAQAIADERRKANEASASKFGDRDTSLILDNIALAIAGQCDQINPRFDVAKFMAACAA